MSNHDETSRPPTPLRVAGVHCGAWLRGDVTGDVFDGWELATGRAVRVRVARATGGLRREAEALVGCDGVHGDADALVTSFEAVSDPLRCWVGTLTRLESRVRAGLGWGVPSVGEVGADGPVLLDVVSGFPVAATLRVVAERTSHGGALRDLVVEWRHTPPSDLSGAAHLIRRALADDLATRRHRLVRDEQAVAQRDRARRLGALVGRLDTAARPFGAGVEAARDARGALDPQWARAWLRSHGREPAASDSARWIRAGLTLRTLRLLLQAAA